MPGRGAELAMIIRARDESGPAFKSAKANVESFSSTASKVASIGLTAIAGAGAAIAAALAGSVAKAATFESALSAIQAVSGASAAQMKQLSDLALKLGADTSFSATEAAVGIGELVKAGVSLGDVMSGGAAAALSLAAAGGVGVGEAAEIASNAMNVFNKTGAEMGHVADVIAGAANASAIDVTDFKFSLAAAGSVAATVGVSFEDLSTAIAVMGQAGIKGSDAGTSLKTMLLNLTPSTKDQIAVAKELGIVTADGANKFFDASGKAKSMAQIAGILQQATTKLTQEQKLNALQTLFGTDAIRAAAVMAKAGADGFNTMAESIGKVTAADVAATRLDNLKGSIEQLTGSLETTAITIGLKFTPYLKGIVNAATSVVNEATPLLEGFADTAIQSLAGAGQRIGDAWRTAQQATAGDWSPSAEIDPFVNKIGEVTTKLRELSQRLQDNGSVKGFKLLLLDVQDVAGQSATNIGKMVDTLGRLGGAAANTDSNLKGTAMAIKAIAIGADLAVLNADLVITSFTTLVRVAADTATAMLGVGKSILALATGNKELAASAARDIADALADTLDASHTWRAELTTVTQRTFADFGDLVRTGSTAAAAEHHRALAAMLADEDASMGSMSVLAQTGMTNVVAAAETQAPQAVAAVEQMGKGMSDGLAAAGPGMTAAANGAASGAVAAVEAQTGPASAAGQSVGDSVGSGMNAGLSGWIGSLMTTARSMVASIFAAGQAEADSHSPSKRAERDLGEPIPQGIIKALEKATPEVQAAMRDMMDASLQYAPVAAEIKRVEGEIAGIREKSQTEALFRAKEMIAVDSETLRLKQAQVALERDALPLRQDLARVTAQISDIERGSLSDRTGLIENDAKRKELRLQQIDLEKQLIGLDPNGKRAKGIQEQIDKLRDQDRLLSLEAEKTTLTNSIAATGARIKREQLDDQARGQQAVIDRIKDQIGVLGAERAVFDANEAVIKNATDNEIDYRNRLIAVFKAEGLPLQTRIEAGLKLVEQLEAEGKISHELAEKLRSVAKNAGISTTSTRDLGKAADIAAPQLDAAAKKAAEMAAQARAANSQVGALATSLGSLPDWFHTESKSGSALFPAHRAMGGPVAAGLPYWVGERGPEVFVPGQGGGIVPNGGLGRGGQTVIVNLNAGTIVHERELPGLVREAFTQGLRG